MIRSIICLNRVVFKLKNQIFCSYGVSGGGQISVVLKIGKDRTIRTIRGNNAWYK